MLIFIAPPLLIENTEWAYRRNWMFFVYPLIFFVVILVFSIGKNSRTNGYVGILHRRLSNEEIAAGIVFLPVLLFIPVLNGYFDDFGLGVIPEVLANLSSKIFPFIDNLSGFEAELVSMEQLRNAQAVKSYMFLALAFSFLMFVVRTMRKPDSLYGLLAEMAKRRMPYKWMESGAIDWLMFILLAPFSFMIAFDLMDPTCDEAEDFMMFTKCAITDDLLFLVNVFFSQIFFFWFLGVAYTVVYCLFRPDPSEIGRGTG